MQTFLPYEDFKASAIVLDRKRLWKQLLEGHQILRTIDGHTNGWSNHPVMRMWRGYRESLHCYITTMALECKYRGIGDGSELIAKYFDLPYVRKRPAWLGDERLHSSHRANLMRKDPIWYCKFGWTDHPYTPYFWPGGE